MSDPNTTLHLSPRQQQFQRSYAHYIGEPRPPLIRRQGEPDDNLYISLGRLIVDKSVSFLFGQAVQFQVTGSDPEIRQDWLDECWRRNRRTLTLQKLATNGGIFGHAFLRLVEGRMAAGGMTFPRLIVLDPQTVEVQTDPEDCETVWKYTITQNTLTVGDADESEQVRHRTIIANPSGQVGERVDAPEQWSIIDQEFRGSSWFTTNQSTWPYPFSPIVDCQNHPRPNDFWGESDLPEDVLKLLDAINRVASHYNKIVRLHAHPKIWTRGMGSRTLDVGIDSVISLPSETAELRALEMQSDLGSTMALLEKLLSLLSYMVRIPLVAMGEPDSLGAISGVALRIRFQPLIEKTEAKRLTYGDLLTEVDRRLLAMGGFGDTTVTQLVWKDLLPTDALAERQTWVLDESLGIVSKQTLSERAGYDFDEEQRRITEEKQTAIAADIAPDPTLVPPPHPIGAPKPDIAKGKTSS